MHCRVREHNSVIHKIFTNVLSTNKQIYVNIQFVPTIRYTKNNTGLYLTVMCFLNLIGGVTYYLLKIADVPCIYATGYS